MSKTAIEPATLPNVDVNMVRPTLDDIPRFTLPPGYRLRAYRPGDQAHWTALHYAAEPFVTITDTLFEEQYGDNRAALPARMFFIEDDAGAVAASISAWWETRDFADPRNRGRIHWVIVHPDHQRRGLTKPMMTAALQVLAQHHDQAMLGTSTGRPWAIKVYLDCGFVPDPAELDRPEVLAAWRRVQALLQHPALAQALPAADEQDTPVS